ncbi:FRG domain-containing protein [Citrobacter sp. JGM124]|uniref:FRG domain-containing protein n=1 Tax=Citrobacter sp. JGM124 TaxID=2799789 RepID=UPI001BAAB12A|nr:FRG domain-containing protein [Citrobacter sp. JGM124]MBS0849976.1 FRG domain-containing protein [Citrobacter sp. JGM124]
MFSLIMGGNPDAFEHWPMFIEDTGVCDFPVSRMLESTSDEIRHKLTPLNEKTLSILEDIPALFMTERYTDLEDESYPDYIEIRIGKVSNLRIDGKYIYFRFIISQKFERVLVTNKKLYETVLELGSFGLNRTHWGVKDKDLQHTLTSLGFVFHKKPQVVNVLPPIEQNKYIEVVDIKDFLAHVLDKDCNENEEVFYRGHSDASYELAPSLFRRNKQGNYKYLQNESSLVREALTARPLEFIDDRTMLDKLVRMQHYGLPTRLLDITSNPLIALYFACSSIKYDQDNNEVDGHVIIFKIDRYKIKFFDSDTVSCIANLSMLSHSFKEALDSKKEKKEFNETNACGKLIHYIKDEKPYFENIIIPSDLERILFVKGRVSNERISSQSGAFLLFGNNAVFPDLVSNEIPEIAQDFKVEKLIIKNKKQILNDLAKLNITEATVYQGMERTMKLIASRFSVSE